MKIDWIISDEGEHRPAEDGTHAITGEAMSTDRPIRVRASAFRPQIATYSNPLSAPTASLVKILKQ